MLSYSEVIRFISDSPYKALPTNVSPPQNIHRLLRPLQYCLPFYDTLRIRLDDFLGEHSGHDS